MNEKTADIISIDQEIKNSFTVEENKLSSYKETQLILVQFLSRSPTNHAHFIIKDNVDDLETKIRDIESGIKKEFYILETDDLLTEYKQELSKPLKVSFMNTKKVDNSKLKKIVVNFLDICKKYIDLDELTEPVRVQEETQNDLACEECNSTNMEYIEDNIYVCLECSTENNIFTCPSAFIDVDRVNISSKYIYARGTHFKDHIDKFQGKQTNFKESTYDDIFKKFKEYNLLQGNEDDELHHRCANIDKQQMMICIKDLGHGAKILANINLIYSHFTGNQSHDVSHLIDDILEDFTVLSKLYDKRFIQTNRVDRKNIINTQCIFYQLLQKYGYPCSKYMFRILKDVDRKNEFEEICEELFDELGWTFKSIF